MADVAYLLDSNICIYMLKGASQSVFEHVSMQVEGSLAISTVTLAEIAVGYGGDAAGAPELAALLTSIPALPFDKAAAMIYAELPFRRGSFDRLLAAHALSIGAAIVTNNEADFADISGLRVENWTLPL